VQCDMHAGLEGLTATRDATGDRLGHNLRKRSDQTAGPESFFTSLEVYPTFFI